MTWREIGELAFTTQNKPAKITTVPIWVMSSVVFLTRLFNRHSGELLAFFTAMATRDVVGPTTGTHTLRTHFQDLGATQ
jgi:hypothetical protein